MTRWQLRQIQEKRKEERKAHITGMIGAILFGLVIGACFLSRLN